MIKNIGKGKSSTGASKAVDLSLLTIKKYKKIKDLSLKQK